MALLVSSFFLSFFLSSSSSSSSRDLQGYPLFKTQVTEIVNETVQFLKVFESIINPINIDVATQIFFALKELTRQAVPNQQAVLAAQVIIPINRILNSWVTRDENKARVRKEINDDEFYEKTFDLKIAIVDFLHTIIEDTTDSQVVTDVINSLNFYACVRIASPSGVS